MNALLDEFGLIRQFFTRPTRQAVLGVGDDCALLATRPHHHLAISTDMLVAGRHFFPDVSPITLGHKALAVNLSDLAAMGAEPRAFTLALSLPEADSTWLAPLAEGMLALADQHQCELVGGDTTRGPLNLCITVFGDVPIHQALRRDAAQIGDDIWVSGTLGDARLVLGHFLQEWHLSHEQLAQTRPRLERPEPRVMLGMALRGVAHAAIDLSDGLLGDLNHILERSQVGAQLEIDALPCSPTLAQHPLSLRHRCQMAGGDDYELCFTAPEHQRQTLAALAKRLSLPLTRIGRITPEPGLQVRTQQGHVLDCQQWQSFNHFSQAR